VNVANGKFTLNGTLLGTAGLTNNFISSIAGSGTAAAGGCLRQFVPWRYQCDRHIDARGLIVESSASIYFDLAFATNSVALSMI